MLPPARWCALATAGAPRDPPGRRLRGPPCTTLAPRAWPVWQGSLSGGTRARGRRVHPYGGRSRAQQRSDCHTGTGRAGAGVGAADATRYALPRGKGWRGGHMGRLGWLGAKLRHVVLLGIARARAGMAAWRATTRCRGRKRSVYATHSVASTAAHLSASSRLRAFEAACRHAGPCPSIRQRAALCAKAGQRSRSTVRASAHAAQYAAALTRVACERPKPPRLAGSRAMSLAGHASSSAGEPRHTCNVPHMAASRAAAYGAMRSDGTVLSAWFARGAAMRCTEAEEEPRALEVGQQGELAEQRVFNFEPFHAPSADILRRADGGAQSHEATLLGRLIATPNLRAQIGDPGRRRATRIVADARLAQIGGDSGVGLNGACDEVHSGSRPGGFRQEDESHQAGLRSRRFKRRASGAQRRPVGHEPRCACPRRTAHRSHFGSSHFGSSLRLSDF